MESYIERSDNVLIKSYNLRNYLISAVIIFAASIVSGIIFAIFHSSSDGIILSLQQLFEPLMNMPKYELVLVIFGNNLLTSFLAIVFGIFFGISPILVLVANGFILGNLSYHVYLDKGIYYVLAGLLPHGIFELSAVITSCALGIRLGAIFLNRLLEKPVPDLKQSFTKSLKIFLCLVIPMLLLASVIEVWLTPIIVGS
jgi:stage II sporulation protein M